MENQEKSKEKITFISQLMLLNNALTNDFPKRIQPIALVGILGSGLLAQKQTDDMNLRLYSELMNQREQAENTLRSQMFKEIFDSFLTPLKGGKGVSHLGKCF